MRATYQQMQGALASSPLRRPLQLSSSETSDGLKGDVYAVVNHPMSSVIAAFGTASHWCDALLLHLNNRDCRVSRNGAGEMITLSVVRKFDKPVDDAFQLPFTYKVVDRAADHLEATLTAGEGPFGTSNYLIVLEAVALDARKSFLHFSYKYDDGTVARKATQAYLATFGRNKVGFTVTGKLPNGEPEYVRGTAGLVERNAMRYFLAVDAYLGAGTPGQGAEAQSVARQKAWFAATEKYPKQLHETDLATYLALKRSDAQRRSRAPAK
ncbi:hypothetical protein QTI66_01525 [Variovorax sp. J22R133]|uniref:hypothetical protein n=1 Tax=Variovorax brevis TaxID=3053503 RepID=UPI002578BA01|nr:hypothetical protein [Variovorax sp. J22R133]MDM0110806.1 hypothetical protein [Variovorax sp. J22R133]